MAKKSTFLFPALILAAFSGLSAFAQTQAINGSIRGHVTDSAATAIPKSGGTAANVDTGFSRSFSTNDEGYFVIPNLPLGAYTVTVQKEGFETQRYTNVVLDAGTEAVLEVQLKVGSVTTTVEVTAGAS